MSSNKPLRIIIKRVGEPSHLERQHTSRPLDEARLVSQFWQDIVSKRPEHEEDKEHLVALILDAKLRLTAFHIVSIGSLNQTIAEPREVFRPVVAMAAYAFILAHNHPSGDPAPSQADHTLTRTIAGGAKILGVQFLDHVIVGAPEHQPPYYSFREAGLL